MRLYCAVTRPQLRHRADEFAGEVVVVVTGLTGAGVLTRRGDEPSRRVINPSAARSIKAVGGRERAGIVIPVPEIPVWCAHPEYSAHLVATDGRGPAGGGVASDETTSIPPLLLIQRSA